MLGRLFRFVSFQTYLRGCLDKAEHLSTTFGSRVTAALQPFEFTIQVMQGLYTACSERSLCPETALGNVSHRLEYVADHAPTLQRPDLRARVYQAQTTTLKCYQESPYFERRLQ